MELLLKLTLEFRVGDKDECDEFKDEAVESEGIVVKRLVRHSIHLSRRLAQGAQM